MLLAFIPPGPFGVAVVALLVIVAGIAAAVGVAEALNGRQDDAVPDPPRPHEHRQVIDPWSHHG